MYCSVQEDIHVLFCSRNHSCTLLTKKPWPISYSNLHFSTTFRLANQCSANIDVALKERIKANFWINFWECRNLDSRRLRSRKVVFDPLVVSSYTLWLFLYTNWLRQKRWFSLLLEPIFVFSTQDANTEIIIVNDVFSFLSNSTGQDIILTGYPVGRNGIGYPARFLAFIFHELVFWKKKFINWIFALWRFLISRFL